MEEKKLTDEIVDILTDFDEYGFQATVTMPNAEEHAKDWKNRLIDLFHRLQDESAKQKAEIERLTRKLDDTISMNEMYVEKTRQNAELQRQVAELKSKEGSFKVGTSVVATTKENDLIGYYGTIVKVQPGEVLVEFNMVNGVKGFRAWLKSSEFVEVE